MNIGFETARTRETQPDNLSDSLLPVSKSTVRYERLAPFVTKSSPFFQISEDTHKKKNLTEDIPQGSFYYLLS
ncbi:hypothetical protein FO485_17230 [Bacillus amyloliquefaciens]|nr:hypothetical protein [Bacillus amyloliquefaciens]